VKKKTDKQLVHFCFTWSFGAA